MNSNCCDAPIYEDTDICSKCKEHCDPIIDDEDIFESLANIINPNKK